MEPLLSQRVRDAARTLEDMSRHYQFRNPREARWSAAELETEAPALEEEEREADDIEKIARGIYSAVITVPWEQATDATKAAYRIAAEKLHAKGWTAP